VAVREKLAYFIKHPVYMYMSLKSGNDKEVIMQQMQAFENSLYFSP